MRSTKPVSALHVGIRTCVYFCRLCVRRPEPVNALYRCIFIVMYKAYTLDLHVSFIVVFEAYTLFVYFHSYV